MLRKGFQHRDISIGNELLCEVARQAKARTSLSQVLTELLSSPNISTDRKGKLERMKALLEQPRINDQWKTFVIDGDLAVNLPEYFSASDPYKTSSRSTAEFMSDELIIAALAKVPYLQSPLDDISSFFYVALWGAVYHTDDTQVGVPMSLLIWRRKLAGDQDSRSFVENRVTARSSKPREVGDFVVKCQSFLMLWRDNIQRLFEEWETLMENDPETQTLQEHFVSFYDRGLLKYLDLLNEKYPSCKDQA